MSNNEDIEYCEFKENLEKFSSIRLCEIIVSNRYIGIMKEEAILAMNALAERRSSGDKFEYENYIQKEFDKLPQLSLDLNKILSIKNWF